MASVTSWTRLEPHPSSPDLPGFAARVGDPLWLLARQWQLGELTGVDGGSPVRTDLTADTAPLTRWLPRPPDGTPGSALDVALPLEVLVEAEVPGAVDDRAAAVAGADLLARLGRLGQVLRSALVSAHPLPKPDTSAAPGVRRRAELLRRRVPDGRSMLTAVRAAAMAGDASTALPGLRRGDAAAVAAARAAAGDWLAAHDGPDGPGGSGGLGGPAGTAPPAWRAGALDHAFAVAAPGPGGTERVLVADAFGGGEVDWWAVDGAPAETLGAATDPRVSTLEVSVIPTRVGAPGLPAPRFWELESGDVNLEAVSAAPEDLGRLLFMEFALVHGNDFYAVPLPVAVGSVTSVRSLNVTTTFGDKVPVRSAVDVDAEAGRRPFRLFRPSIPGGSADWLVVLPTAVGALTGPPVEEVLLSRDETANVAWAVERTVPGIDGRGADRAEALHRAAAPPPEQDDDAEPAAPAQRYRLFTPVPENWLPLLPATRGPAATGRPVLRLSGPAAAGTLLTPGMELDAERLGRAGVLLRRAATRARAADGRPLTWIARRTAPGRGESSSGLRFDDLEAAGDS